MLLKPFGKTELKTSELGLGCARIGGIFQQGASGFVNLLRAARSGGINFFDTADMYSQGESEVLIGKAFRGERDRIIIASKAGYLLPARRRLVARLKPFLRPAIQFLKIRRDQLPGAVRGHITQNFSPDYLMSAVEGSLRRLNTDYIDLLQLHSPPLEIVERGTWLRALETLRRDGKIRYFGISVDTIDAGLAALRYEGIASLQFSLSLLERMATEALLPAVREKGIAAIARECLANGLLVKPLDQLDLSTFCKTPEEERSKREQIVNLRAEAERENTSLAALAIRYVTRTSGVSVSLIGARNVEQLDGLLRHAASAAVR